MVVVIFDMSFGRKEQEKATSRGNNQKKMIEIVRHILAIINNSI